MADVLKWLHEVTDKNVAFWQTVPDTSIFEKLNAAFVGWHRTVASMCGARSGQRDHILPRCRKEMYRYAMRSNGQEQPIAELGCEWSLFV